MTRAGTLTLELAFAPITLSLEEADTIQAGDVLVVGGAELASAAGGLSVVTSTGWVLGAATLDLDTPLSITAQLKTPCLATPHPPIAMDGAPVQIVARIGQAELPIAEVIDRLCGADPLRLTLAKPDDSPITLWIEGRCVGGGELVTLDQELAVRITDWSSAPSPTGSDAP